MRSTATITCFVFAGLLAVVVCSRPARSQDEGPRTAEDATIRGLLVERQDTLRQLLDAVTVSFQVGRATASEVIRAHHALLGAELELADSKAQRIRAFQGRLDQLRKLEDMLKAKHAAGIARTEEVLAARAARLEAQIELFREKATED